MFCLNIYGRSTPAYGLPHSDLPIKNIMYVLCMYAKEILDLKASLKMNDHDLAKVKKTVATNKKTSATLKDDFEKSRRTVQQQQEEIEDLKIDLDELE